MSALPDSRLGPELVRHDDQTLFEAPDCPPLLPCQEVQAICIHVRRTTFRGFGERLVFTFRVVIPPEYAGAKLEMYVRAPRAWKRPPISSKLFKVAAVACGGLPRGRRITRDLFEGKLFRCRMKVVGEGAAAYSIVDRITERLTR